MSTLVKDEYGPTLPELLRGVPRWIQVAAWSGIAVLLAVGAGLATRAVLDARAEQAASEAEAVALSEDASTASAEAAQSSEDAYLAEADAICTRGWADGKVTYGDAPPREDRQRYASWLEGMVGIGEQTLERWRRLSPPGAMDAEITRVLDRYQEALEAYDGAAAQLAAGQTEEADNLLSRGDRISADYRRLATQAGFVQCNTALPL